MPVTESDRPVGQEQAERADGVEAAEGTSERGCVWDGHGVCKGVV